MKYIFGLNLILFGTVISLAQEWQVTTISNDGLKPVLAIDREDRVHVVYMSEASSGWVKYALIETGVVSGSTVSTGYFYGPPDITYDNDNDPVIAYHDHDTENQAVRRWQNGMWQNIDTEHRGHDGWDNSILVDEDGFIHTSSVEPFGGPGIEYGFYADNVWRVDSIGSGPIMYANATSIGLDSENNVHISYFNDGLRLLQFASRKAGVWKIEDIDEDEKAGRFSSMLIDEKDDVFISYYTESGLIKLASRLDNNWSTTIIDSLDNVEIGFSGARNLTSLAQYQDDLYIAYSDKSIIKLARISSAGVQIDTVLEKTDQDFGQMVSLDFTSTGTPFIAFPGSRSFNNPFGNIFVVSKSGMSTSTNRVDESQRLIFPNPIRAGEILQTEHWANALDFQLLDLHGDQIVKGKIDSQGIRIPSQMVAGVYVLQFREEHQHIRHFQKIVVLAD